MSERPFSRRQAISQALLMALGGGSAISLINLSDTGGDFVKKRPKETTPQIIESQYSTLEQPVDLGLRLLTRGGYDSIRVMFGPSGADARLGTQISPAAVIMLLPEPPASDAELLFLSLDDGVGGVSNISALLYTTTGILGNREYKWGDNTDATKFKDHHFVVPAGGSFVFNGGTLETSFAADINPKGQGANVGQPTGSGGSASGTLCNAFHRHGFTGRFSASAFNPLGVGAGFPLNFHRIKLNNAWTMRRLWVYAQAGPTGGTETYALVNAAGVVQGTAVVLPAGPGATQAETGLQTTNLTGSTLYYLAQTAIGAGWAAGAANVMVGLEYTMNV